MTVLKWLELNFLQSGRLHDAERLYQKYLRILRTRGKREGIAYCKRLRSSLVQWLTTINSLDEEVRTSSKVGLPRDLRFLKRRGIKVNDAVIRLILSSLYGSRDIRLPPDSNIENIVSGPRSESGFPSNFDQYIGDFWDTLGYRLQRGGVPKSVRWKKFHLSTKSGPTGQALWTSL